MADPYAAFKDADPYAQFSDAPGDHAAPGASPAAQPSSSLAEWGKELGSAAIRPIVKAVTAMPSMAMDAGVATRNLVHNLSQGIMPTWSDFNPFPNSGPKSPQEYELPSQSFNRALDTYTRAPTTGWGKAGEFLNTALLSSRLPAPEAAEQAPANFVPQSVRTSGLTISQQNAAEQGENLGMQLTPGQQLGSKPLQQLEAKMQSQPWTSGPLNRIAANNQSVLNSAAAQSIGENANVVDSSVLARANDRLSSVFENVGDPSRITVVDPAKTQSALDAIDQQAEGLIDGSIRDNKLVQRLESLTDMGSITGQQLRQLTSKLGKAAYKQMATPSGDRDMGQALYAVKDHVDDLIGQGLSDTERVAYDTTREQYRNLMLLTSRTGIVNPSSGNVAGVALASKLQQADKPGFLYGRNQSDLYNAARFAQAFKPIVGDSGTATRSLNLADLMSAHYGIPLNMFARAYASPWGQSATRGLMAAPELLQNPQPLAAPLMGGLLALR